jgi:hypothetical protein
VRQLTHIEVFFSTVENKTDGNALVFAKVEECGMFRYHQIFLHPRPRRSSAGDNLWLSMLIDRFEKISQTDLGAVACGEPILLALKAQLARPVSPRGGRGSDFRFLN